MGGGGYVHRNHKAYKGRRFCPQTIRLIRDGDGGVVSTETIRLIRVGGGGGAVYVIWRWVASSLTPYVLIVVMKRFCKNYHDSPRCFSACLK